MSWGVVPTPRERLHRLRTRSQQEPHVHEVERWWVGLTGRPFVLCTDPDLVWRAGRLVGIAPDFDLCDLSLHRIDRLGALADALDDIGTDPYVLLAETSAVGLVDAGGSTATGIAALLMAWDVDGADFVLLRRDLCRALSVSWDREDAGLDVQITRFVV